MPEIKLTAGVKNKARQLGADLVGIADPIPNRCGKCRNCLEACPSGAIKAASWEDHPENREVALDFAKCVDKLTKDFAQRPLIGKPICGVCIKVCPWSGL